MLGITYERVCEKMYNTFVQRKRAPYLPNKSNSNIKINLKIFFEN